MSALVAWKPQSASFTGKVDEAEAAKPLKVRGQCLVVHIWRRTVSDLNPHEAILTSIRTYTENLLNTAGRVPSFKGFVRGVWSIKVAG